jgi:hypothetical protein
MSWRCWKSSGPFLAVGAPVPQDRPLAQKAEFVPGQLAFLMTLLWEPLKEEEEVLKSL